MLALAQARTEVTSMQRTHEAELVRTLLCASSLAEAGFALSILRESVPERALVTALNLREVLADLPASPFPMAVDAESLGRIANMHRDRSALVLSCGDGARIEALVEGNLCFDIVLKSDGASAFLKTRPAGEDIIKTDAYGMLMGVDGLLEQVIELVKAMGLVFNPRLYFSIEDWLSENAADTLTDLWGVFGK